MPLTLLRTVEPAVEPIAWDEARAHLRLDSEDEKTLVEALIVAARASIEEYLQKQLITATWTLTLDAFPDSPMCAIELPRPPIISVTSLTYYDEAGVQQTLAASSYQVDLMSRPGRIVAGVGLDWPTIQTDRINAITVTYTAGYGAAATSVPRAIRQAILLLVGEWFENRENIIVGTIVSELPQAAKALAAPYRTMTAR